MQNIQNPQTFSDDTYKKVFGVEDRKSINFAENLVNSLHKIDPTLLPKIENHPYEKWISKGHDGVHELESRFEAENAENKIYILDAISQIYINEQGCKKTPDKLKAWIRNEKSADVKAYIAKVLAISSDEAFMREQMNYLADDDPRIVATAARLLGYGAYSPALPALKALVTPARMFESRYVIWAIGEIGSSDALPELEYSLEQGFRSIDCLIAIGKIGMVTSVPKIMPFLHISLAEQREAAYRALAMILNANIEYEEIVAPLGDMIIPIIMDQLENKFDSNNTAARFHMLLCLARLGHKMEKSMIRKYLGIDLGEQDAGDMAAFFMRKR